MFEVIVFTASEMRYASKVVEMIDPLGFIDHILDRKACISVGENEFIKDLSILGRRKEETLIVDNSLGAVRQLEALIPIIPFYGDENDRQLYEILPYLKELSEVEDLVKRNKEMFEWELFAKAEKYEHFFKAIRKKDKLK